MPNALAQLSVHHFAGSAPSKNDLILWWTMTAVFVEGRGRNAAVRWFDTPTYVTCASTLFLLVPMIASARFGCCGAALGSGMIFSISLLNHGIARIYKYNSPMPKILHHVALVDRAMGVSGAITFAAISASSCIEWFLGVLLIVCAGLIYIHRLDYDGQHPSAVPALWHVLLHLVASAAMTLGIVACHRKGCIAC